MRLLLSLAALLLVSGVSSAGTPSNVVVILLDDVGLDQLAVYDDQNQYTDPKGYSYAYTPNIDALAATGVRFTQFRTMPVCSSTRASLLSGRYPFWTGTGAGVKTEFLSPGFTEFNKLPAPRSVLLPTILGKAGFEPAAIGKWHLGLDPSSGGTMDWHPADLGFPTWWGVPGNLVGSGSPLGSYYDFWWVENTTRTRVTGVYATDRTINRAQAWLATAPQPYFLYLSLNACHTPLGGVSWPPAGHGFGPQPPPLKHQNTNYRACLEYADLRLGALLSTLVPNTLVILMGDNGTIPAAIRAGKNEERYPIGHPLHQPGDEVTQIDITPYHAWQMKKSPFEGGIRAPLIVSGAGVANPGSSSADLVDVVDLYPTIAKLSGAKLPVGQIHGLDFSKVITKPNGRGRRSTSFSEFFTPNGVVSPAPRTLQWRTLVRREKKHLWKLIHYVENEPGKPPVVRYEFYHLAGPSKKTPVDPLETKDLGTSHPAFQKTKRAYLELVGKS